MFVVGPVLVVEGLLRPVAGEVEESSRPPAEKGEEKNLDAKEGFAADAFLRLKVMSFLVCSSCRGSSLINSCDWRLRLSSSESE